MEPAPAREEAPSTTIATPADPRLSPEHVIVVKARDPMHAVGDGFAAGGAAYDAHIAGAGALAFRANRADRRGFLRSASRPTELTLQTVGVARGGISVDPHERPATLEAGGVVAIHRGVAIEEIEATDTEIEQRWTFATRPQGDGDVVVRVRVQGAELRNTTARGLHFASKKAETGVRYTDATWVDAVGARSKIAARFEDSEIVFRVPSALVEGSAYPAVLDPEVSVERGADDAVFGPAATLAGAVVASNGTNYLALWASLDNGLYASRISATGDLIGTSFLVGRVDGGPNYLGRGTTPSVAFDGTNYLAVWPYQGNVVGVRISSAGALLDPTPIPLAAALAAGTQPAIAFDGDAFLLTWYGALPNNTTSAYGARVSKAAAFLSSFPLAAPGSVGSPYAPSIAPSVACDPAPTGFCVASNIGGVFKVARDNTVTAFAGLPGQSAVAFDGTNFLAISSGSPGALISRAGVVGPIRNYYPDIGPGASVERHALVAKNGGGFVLLYVLYEVYDCENCGSAVFGKYQVLGADAEPKPSVTLPGDGQPFAAAALNGELGVSVSFGASYGMSLMRLNAATGAPLGTTANISILGNTERAPGVAWNGKAFLATWTDSRGGLYGARLSPDGVTQNATAFPVGPTRPTLSVSNGVDYHLLSSGISTQKVSEDGVVGAVTASGVSSAGSAAAAAVFDGTNYFVVWTGPSSSGKNVFGARIAPSGVAVDTAPVQISFKGASGNPRVAFDGTQFLVVWERGAEGAEDIDAARVTVAGGKLTAQQETSLSGTTPGRQFRPQVVADGVSFLVVWQDTRNAVIGDIYATVVNADGSMPKPPAPIAPNGLKEAPLLAYTGDGATSLLFWKAVAINGKESFRCGWIKRATTELLSELLVTDGEARTPTLASRGDGTVLIAYTTRDTGDDRVRVRLASAGKAPGGACGGVAECNTGFCVDGVCCESRCDAPCQTCSAKPGACTPVTLADDGDTCTGANTCSAEGKCAKRLGTACKLAGECASGFCSDALCCDTACDGSCDTCSAVPGKCTIATAGAVSASPSCGPTLCDGTSASCPAKCAADQQCASGYVCNVDTGACIVAARCIDDRTVLAPTGETTVCGGSFACRAGACLTTCRSVEDCAGGALCDQGRCSTASSFVVSTGEVGSVSSGCDVAPGPTKRVPALALFGQAFALVLVGIRRARRKVGTQK
jgi:hypothetical protein